MNKLGVRIADADTDDDSELVVIETATPTNSTAPTVIDLPHDLPDTHTIAKATRLSRRKYKVLFFFQKKTKKICFTFSIEIR